MVTDAAVGGARTETVIPYGVRLAITILLLGLYVLGHRVPLPSVDMDAMAAIASFSSVRVSILMMELNPLITGFVLVELFSLLTSPGRRLRKAGTAGRARLNRAALITSLAVAAVQAASISMYLVSMTAPDGSPLVIHPGLAFQLLVIVTLTAVTAALFAMGKFLSVYGIGNGFVLLLLARAGLSAASKETNLGGLAQIATIGGIVGLLLVAGLVLLLFRFLQKADDAWLPAFPQSILPAYLSLMGVTYLFGISPGLGRAVSVGSFELAAPGVTLIAILLLSWAGFHLFSSHRRLAAELPEPQEVIGDLAASLRRQAVVATAALAIGTAALVAWQQNAPPSLASWPSFPGVVMFVAILLDLWDQFRFQRRHSRFEFLAQLDNVHFSYWLEDHLQEEGIAALARGHRMRSLFFFLGPLFKIDVLVPREQLSRARQVLAELEAASEIKAF
jgi:hypothetical protein